MATSASNGSTSSLARIPSILDYPDSPRVRNRHQVKWSDVMTRAPSSPTLEEPSRIKDGSEISLHIEELESSPSRGRRQRKQHKRNRKKHHHTDDEDLPLAVTATTSTDSEALSGDEVPDQHSHGVSQPQRSYSESRLGIADPVAAVNDVSNTSHAEVTEESLINFRLHGHKAPVPDKSLMSRLPFSDISLWMALSLGLLLLSNISFFGAFVTHSWGTISDVAKVDNGGNVSFTTDELWYFGLWRCCRYDGLCIGARWSAFYSATRVFAVMALFGHAFSFALIFGHTVERLLDYDPCTMLSMIASCFITAILVVITVSVYGVLWPIRFNEMLFSVSFLSTTRLGYSFYLALICAPLMTIAGVFALVDLNSSRKAWRVRQTFAEVYDDADDADDEIVVDKNYQTFTAPPPDDVTDIGIDGTERLHSLTYLDRSSLFQEDSLI